MKILYCEHCGNLVVYTNKVETPIVCCGETMKVLEAGVKDAAVEKHVPVLTREGNNLHVAVGEVAHPMGEDHFIETIIVEQGDFFQVVKLNPGDAPEADFVIKDGPVTVYEFCNLHGLWKAEA